MEDTPTWPPDYNSWPQTATQAPPQLLPQYPPSVPTQTPLQGPYQVPPVVPTQISVPVVSRASTSLTVPQERPPYSTSQAQIWPSRVKPQNDLKLVPAKRYFLLELRLNFSIDSDVKKIAISRLILENFKKILYLSTL